MLYKVECYVLQDEDDVFIKDGEICDYVAREEIKNERVDTLIFAQRIKFIERGLSAFYERKITVKNKAIPKNYKNE